ncbi:hypothetical protein Hanom_Chr08g00729731 [Helianthus anomalus]
MLINMLLLSCLIQFFFGFTLSILTDESVKRETGLMQTLSYCCRVHHYSVANNGKLQVKYAG